MVGSLLDALRHRLVKKIDPWDVVAAPRLTIEHHYAAPHCIPDAQCQKTVGRAKKLLPSRFKSSHDVQFLVNFVQFLCNWLQVAANESNLHLSQKDVFQNCSVVAKNQCPHKKILCPTADRHNSAQSCTMAGTMPISCFKQKQTACNPETWFSPLCTQCQKPLCTSKNPLPTFSAKKKDKSFRQNLG